jgi:hypothetical protein
MSTEQFLGVDMQCYNSRCADEYAHQQGLEAERDEALEDMALELLGDLPCFIQDAIFERAQKDADFCRAYDNWISDELNKKIENDREPY